MDAQATAVYYTRILRDGTEIKFRMDTEIGKQAFEADQAVPAGSWSGSDLNETADALAIVAADFDRRETKDKSAPVGGAEEADDFEPPERDLMCDEDMPVTTGGRTMSCSM